MKALILASLSFFLLMACGNEERENMLKLAAEKHSLNCEMEQLRGQADSVWDELESYLDKNLPADMPPVERKNMVTIRNANLITMFKAFPDLDDAIQQKVNEAGAADSRIAESMKAVMGKISKVEQAMNEALQKIQERSEQQCQAVKQELLALENNPCNPPNI